MLLHVSGSTDRRQESEIMAALMGQRLTAETSPKVIQKKSKPEEWVDLEEKKDTEPNILKSELLKADTNDLKTNACFKCFKCITQPPKVSYTSWMVGESKLYNNLWFWFKVRSSIWLLIAEGQVSCDVYQWRETYFVPSGFDDSVLWSRPIKESFLSNWLSSFCLLIWRLDLMNKMNVS